MNCKGCDVPFKEGGGGYPHWLAIARALIICDHFNDFVNMKNKFLLCNNKLQAHTFTSTVCTSHPFVNNA